MEPVAHVDQHAGGKQADEAFHDLAVARVDDRPQGCLNCQSERDAAEQTAHGAAPQPALATQAAGLLQERRQRNDDQQGLEPFSKQNDRRVEDPVSLSLLIRLEPRGQAVDHGERLG